MGLAGSASPALRLQYVLIEDAGSGHSLYQALKHRIRLHVIPIGPQGDQQGRAVEVTPEIEVARVFLPKEAGWWEELEYELEIFPMGEHDDIVDSVVQYLNWARYHTGDAGITAVIV